MTTTAVLPDLGTIEHLDFDPPCENEWCDDDHPPAVALVREIPCVNCGHQHTPSDELICKLCMDDYDTYGGVCVHCDGYVPPGLVYEVLHWIKKP